MSEPSVFTRIINGQLPCFKIYEDNLTLAIIPLYPIALGHVIVLPKKQIDQFYDLDDKDYIALMATVKLVAAKMKLSLNPKRVGLKVVGLDEPHAHVHVIAFNTLEQYNESDIKDSPVDNKYREELANKLKINV